MTKSMKATGAPSKDSFSACDCLHPMLLDPGNQIFQRGSGRRFESRPLRQLVNNINSLQVIFGYVPYSGPNTKKSPASPTGLPFSADEAGADHPPAPAARDGAGDFDGISPLRPIRVAGSALSLWKVSFATR
jgi:hypothetical protein